MRRDLWHIHLCFVPATSTATCQPLDISLQGPLKVRLARCVAEHMSGEVVAAMDDGRPAKLDLRFAQLKAPLMRWVGRSLAELSGMEDLHRKAWAHVTVDEENMPEALRSAEEKQKRSELFVEQIPPAARCVDADDEHQSRRTRTSWTSGPLAGTTAS